MKPTVNGKVVEPFEVVGTDTPLFSVFTQVIVSATAEKSYMRTINGWPSIALAVVQVIVIVAAEELVNVFNLKLTDVEPAFVVTVTALLIKPASLST